MPIIEMKFGIFNTQHFCNDIVMNDWNLDKKSLSKFDSNCNIVNL